MKRRVTASLDATGHTTELRIRVEQPQRVKRSPPARVLRNVFPAGAWGPATKDKACAEYHYLRAAAGFCRMCPNKREHYKHRCDDCQEKERKRWAAKQATYNAARKPELVTVKRPPRKSKFRFAAIRWLHMKKRKGEL